MSFINFHPFRRERVARPQLARLPSVGARIYRRRRRTMQCEQARISRGCKKVYPSEKGKSFKQNGIAAHFRGLRTPCEGEKEEEEEEKEARRAGDGPTD